ncbi:hypothetical protein [Pseudobdellovibrio exovorus]|uniref:Uncharacterized protein n=1 Tax=Pseudobdellovibrio exovorus JSS TaxID=1184267 RepID=M4VF89_9BACT|nr:hypothetical protein [Pseudobdellovibrio exovorus]AGH96716.1 hypothetical protein A11Q_2500 [Pseudobdellovibrio exovorus JSS]
MSISATGIHTMNDDLKVLVQELSKTNPNADVIKTKTDMLGIPYSSDLIIMMSEVLVYLSKVNNPKNA